ncbi:MAG: 50S ribosomal protein L11 methyltransferase [Pirellulaceae bacterium]
MLTRIQLPVLTLCLSWCIYQTLPSVTVKEREEKLDVHIVSFHHVPELESKLAQFNTVFWDARDSESLRKLIGDGKIASGLSVLEIGTGTGIISLCCLRHGAARVVATDINPRAVANAKYNAERLGLFAHLDVRRVAAGRPGAYSVIGDGEKFDLIISNPPWEDAVPRKVSEFAVYDTEFQLLDSILRELDRHLTGEGRALLVYGCVTAIDQLVERAGKYELKVTQLDDRDLTVLPELFLPGMLLEVRR